MRMPSWDEPEPDVEPFELERLYDDHGAYVQALLARLLGPAGDADDFTQEVFILAWRKIGSFHGGSARAWLTQIAVKLAATARRRARMRRVLGLAANREDADERTPEAIAGARESSRMAAAILERMGEKKRTVFVLYELQGLSGQEIGEVLGIPLQTVHTRLYHARREFVTELEAAQRGLVEAGRSTP